jgi:hypothetical protein
VSFAYAQDLGQLGPVRVVLCPPSAAESYLVHRHAAGRNFGDVKPARLADADSWTAVLGGGEIARARQPSAPIARDTLEGSRTS